MLYTNDKPSRFFEYGSFNFNELESVTNALLVEQLKAKLNYNQITRISLNDEFISIFTEEGNLLNCYFDGKLNIINITVVPAFLFNDLQLRLVEK